MRINVLKVIILYSEFYSQTHSNLCPYLRKRKGYEEGGYEIFARTDTVLRQRYEDMPSDRRGCEDSDGDDDEYRWVDQGDMQVARRRRYMHVGGAATAIYISKWGLRGQ